LHEISILKGSTLSRRDNRKFGAGAVKSTCQITVVQNSTIPAVIARRCIENDNFRYHGPQPLVRASVLTVSDVALSERSN